MFICGDKQGVAALAQRKKFTAIHPFIFFPSQLRKGKKEERSLQNFLNPLSPFVYLYFCFCEVFLEALTKIFVMEFF